MEGVRLPYGNDDDVVEDALPGHPLVHHLRDDETQGWKEDPLRRLGQVAVLHGGPADDRGRVHGIGAMGESGDVKNRVLVFQRVVASVVAERPLDPHLLGVDIAFQHELRGRGHLDVDGPALHQVHRGALDEAGQQHLVHALGHGGGGRVGDGRGRPDGHRHLHPLALPLMSHVVVAPVLVDVPVHSGGVAVIDLHAVHARVPPPVHALGEDHGEGHETPAVLGPAFQYGERAEVHLVALQDDLLAGRARRTPDAGDAPGKSQYLRQGAHLAHEGGGHLHLQQPGDPGC